MNQVQAGFIDDLVGRIIGIHSEIAHARLDLRIGILGGKGHGDHMRTLAFANAVRYKYPEALITVIYHFTAGGGMVEWDMMHAAKTIGVIDASIPIQALPRSILCGERVAGQFDLFFDTMPYPVGTYWNVWSDRSGMPASLGEYQGIADARLKPFRTLYDGHPLDNWRVRYDTLSQWDIMSASSGINVSEMDLFAPTECAPMPEQADLAMFGPDALAALTESAGVDNWERAKLSGVPRYVVIHTGVGRRSEIKLAPPQVFKAIVTRLGADGIRCVQIGGKGEALVDDAIDRRGLRLPLSARLMGGAIAFVATEGFIPYVGAGVGVPGVVLFGPTLPHVFGLKGRLNLIGCKQDGHVRCPAGTCFFGGGIWPAGEWGDKCPLGAKDNPAYPYCCNMATPAEAAEHTAQYVQRMEAARS